MSRRCEMLVTEEDGQKLVGRIMLDGDKISSTAEKGYERLMTAALENEHWVDRGRRTVKKDRAKEWFNSLELNYLGSRLRARFVK